MSYPFTYINGESIDLKKQEHRDVVIKRNKTLEAAVKFGIDFYKSNIQITVSIKTELDCLKCGTSISKKNSDCYDEINDLDDLEAMHPVLICKNKACNTKYRYNTNEGVYFPILKKIKF